MKFSATQLYNNFYLKQFTYYLIALIIFISTAVLADEANDQQSYENLTSLLKEMNYVNKSSNSDDIDGLSYQENTDNEEVKYQLLEYNSMPDFFIPKKPKAKKITIDGKPFFLMGETINELPKLDGGSINVELKIP
jgi:hypothetical protein